MPPRSPTGSPHSRASWSRGRTPAEKTTRSVSSSESSDSLMPTTAPFPPVTTSWVPTPVCTSTPSPATIRRSASPPPSSTWTGISRGANSTTWVVSPRPLSAPAASRPSSPPPTTAPVRDPAAYSSMAWTSSMVR